MGKAWEYMGKACCTGYMGTAWEYMGKAWEYMGKAWCTEYMGKAWGKGYMDKVRETKCDTRYIGKT